MDAAGSTQCGAEGSRARMRHRPEAKSRDAQGD
jgi:hypothetical protein